MRHATARRFVTLAIGAATTVSAVWAQPGDAPFYLGRDMMWGGDQWGGFGMVIGPIVMIGIGVGIIVGTIYIMQMFGVAGGGHPAHDRALMVLKERYAKGEIDTAEFEERKKLLTD